MSPSDAIAPPPVTTVTPAAVDTSAIAQLLGAVQAQEAAAAPEAASRFSLLGVIADTDQQGAALIAVDGKPPRPFRVGAKVVDGFVLQSVGTRAAMLGASLDSDAALTLQLPTRPLAANPPPATPGVASPSASRVVTPPALRPRMNGADPARGPVTPR